MNSTVGQVGSIKSCNAKHCDAVKDVLTRKGHILLHTSFLYFARSLNNVKNWGLNKL